LRIRNKERAVMDRDREQFILRHILIIPTSKIKDNLLKKVNLFDSSNPEVIFVPQPTYTHETGHQDQLKQGALFGIKLTLKVPVVR
jgi:hypothetical protein